MANVFQIMPDLEGDEMVYVQGIMKDMNELQAQQFANAYRARRKDPQTIFIMAVIGLFGVAGIHRFFLGNIGLGVVYFLTAGLCFIGTIVDLVNYKRLAFEYNVTVAQQVAIMVKGLS